MRGIGWALALAFSLAAWYGAVQGALETAELFKRITEALP